MGRPSPTPHVKRPMRRFGVSHKWRGPFGLELDWRWSTDHVLTCSSVTPPPRYLKFSHPHHPSFNYLPHHPSLNIPAVTYCEARQPLCVLTYSQGVEIPTKSLRWSLEGALLWVCDFFFTFSNIIGDFVSGGEEG